MAKENLKDMLRADIERNTIILEILEKYTDLEEHSDRWNNKRYMSKLANKDCDKVMMHHSCGCCPDAVLYAMPYLEYKGIQIFSNPPQISIGEHNGSFGTGEKPWGKWQEKLKSENIHSSVIDKVDEFFKENPPIDFDD